MEKATFIKINNTRIKLSNIKNYGISERDNVTLEHYKIPYKDTGIIYKRRIWFSDYIMKKTVFPVWEDISQYDYENNNKKYKDIEFMGALNLNWGDIKPLIPLFRISKSDLYEEHSGASQESLDEELSDIRGKYALKYAERQRNKGLLAKIFVSDNSKISEELSSQFVIWIGDNPPECFFTKGKLYYDGVDIRCEGSPFRIFKATKGENGRETGWYVGTQPRVTADERELIVSGEVTRVNYNVDRIRNEVKEIKTKERYLYVTTYQKDNFIFVECDCDIDDVIKKLDDNLAI